MSDMTSGPSTLTGSVDMTHGGGGRAMAELIRTLFQKHFSNPVLDQGNDGALVALPPGRVVISTDSHVITPLFFPGGDIGALSINGTVNDVAMMGAKPLYLSVGFILEEGFPLADLERIVISMAAAAKAADVTIATGDTKVVEKGKGDGVFISTTGIGVVPEGVKTSGDNARPGQAVLVSGTIGDHGVAILSKRESLEFETEIVSDCAALNGMIANMLAAVPNITTLRDPTRGGLAATLNEIASASKVGMMLEESAIPIRPDVSAACEFLGLDALYVANEGKLICICEEADANRLVDIMRAHPLGENAARIGTVIADDAHLVQMRTGFGGTRVVDWIAGEQLPRIC